MSEKVYKVTIYDTIARCYVRELIFDNKEQALAATKYFYLYYKETCNDKEVVVNEITIETKDYIHELEEYEAESRRKQEKAIKDEIAYVKKLIQTYEEDYGVKFD